jgi:hypothetical protein
MFLKWLIDHWTEQLKHASVIVSHTFLYLILLLMFFVGSLLKGVLDGKQESAAAQRPIIVIVQHADTASPRTPPKKRRGSHRRLRIRKPRTNQP